MAKVKGYITLADGSNLTVEYSVCLGTLRKLFEEIMSDLNNLGAWEHYGSKGYITFEDLVYQYCGTNGFQKFINKQSLPDFHVTAIRFSSKVFQEFPLNTRKARKKGAISPSVWNVINEALWIKGLSVIYSKETVDGWPVTVILGVNVGFQYSPDDARNEFIKLTGGEKDSPYETEGAIYSQDFPNQQ